MARGAWRRGGEPRVQAFESQSLLLTSLPFPFYKKKEDSICVVILALEKSSLRLLQSPEILGRTNPSGHIVQASSSRQVIHVSVISLPVPQTKYQLLKVKGAGWMSGPHLTRERPLTVWFLFPKHGGCVKRGRHTRQFLLWSSYHKNGLVKIFFPFQK